MMLKSKNPEFVIRHTILADAKAYYEANTDDEAMKNFSTCPKNLAEARKEIMENIRNMNNKKAEFFTIEINGEAAGFFWIMDIVRRHKAIIGYGLKKEFRGKGIGTKALKMISNYAFNKYKLVRLWTKTRDFNKPSIRILQKAGFKYEGTMKKSNLRDGKFRNDTIWGKIK